MKKITGIMLAVVMLVSVLSVSAFAVNAPLTAAEYFANRNVAEDASTGGTIGFSIADPVLPKALDTEITGASDPSLWTLVSDGSDYAEAVDASANEFDVIAKFDTAKAYAGYRLAIFYNPEIVRPVQLYNNTVYDINIIDGYDAAELPENLTLGVVADYLEDLGGMTYQSLNQTTDSSADYTKYLDGDASAYASWEDQLIDGMTTMVAAGAKNVTVANARKSELARWPFEFVAADNNWYRTKIVGSYDQFANATTAIAPTITDNGVMYIENEAYTGPAFDIVGAMKADEGKLRFGSVYFADGGVHDNETVIVDAGVVLYPSELLDNETLTLDTEGAVVISAAGYYAINGDEYTYTGVLTGLAGNEDMYITARSFVKYMDGANEVVVYSDPIARNLNNVDDADMK